MLEFIIKTLQTPQIDVPYLTGEKGGQVYTETT